MYVSVHAAHVRLLSPAKCEDHPWPRQRLSCTRRAWLARMCWDEKYKLTQASAWNDLHV